MTENIGSERKSVMDVTKNLVSKGTLNPCEPHPSAQWALRYLCGVVDKFPIFLESFSSCAIEGNRLAEVCDETLSRLMSHQPVSDRYLLGLAWAIRDLEEMEKEG